MSASASTVYNVAESFWDIISVTVSASEDNKNKTVAKGAWLVPEQHTMSFSVSWSWFLLFDNRMLKTREPKTCYVLITASL